MSEWSRLMELGVLSEGEGAATQVRSNTLIPMDGEERSVQRCLPGQRCGPRRLACAGLALLAVGWAGLRLPMWHGPRRGADMRSHSGGGIFAEEQGAPDVGAFCGEVDEDVEYHTKDHLYWVGNILTWEECCAECDAQPDCGVWTYGQQKGVEGLSGHCYLKKLAKWEVPERVRRPGVVSGSISKKFEKHGIVAKLLSEREAARPDELFVAENGTCPGSIDVDGHGSVRVVTALWKKPGEKAAPVDVAPDGWAIMPRLNSRAYLADNCTAGEYRASEYTALKLLGGSIRYTVDLSRAGCGCNAQLHLLPLHTSKQESMCHDYYCTPGWSACGAVCADIGLQDSNKYAWASQLHLQDDQSGASGGYGGGATSVGRRSWSESQYGPGARCIDTTWPFNVEVSFPVNSKGMLEAMEVTLSQDMHPCPLKLRLDNYTYSGRDGMAELSKVLEAGVTPALSYWSSSSLEWMDGAGSDGRGPCVEEAPEACPEAVRFYNFAVEQNVAKEARAQAEATENMKTPLEEALEDIHKDIEEKTSEEQRQELASMEAGEEEEDCADNCHTQMVRISDFRDNPEKVRNGTDATDENSNTDEFIEIESGNAEWEVIIDNLKVMSKPDSSSDVLSVMYKGQVLVGKLTEGFLDLAREPGYVDPSGLMERKVSYEKIVKGTCSDAHMFPIPDIQACAAAAFALGYFDTHVRVTGHPNRPEGCYLHKGRIWVSTAPANSGNGAHGGREPICSSSEYLTTTTVTTTMTTTWGFPSLFCIEVTRTKGYELPLVQEQMKQGASIFGCDEYVVFSDGGKPRFVGVGPDGRELKTIVIPPIRESMGSLATGATTNSWLNTETFLQVWDILKKDGRFMKHDWSVKVDPDAVFFPDRLRGHLKAHTWEGANFYVMNCNRWEMALFGSIEIFSKKAVENYLNGQWRCRNSLPWHGWGEDYFMSHCMDMLGVGRIYDWSLLSDKRCFYSPCSDTSKVAFHDYKDPEPDGSWFKCFEQSQQGR